MSELILLCAWCDKEILNADEARGTVWGRIVCEDCAVNSYGEIPLE